MKKFFIISAGTIGGLGGVLLFNHPNLATTNNLTAVAGKSSSSTVQTPAAQAPAVSSKSNGTFAGSAVDVGYGNVQVSITVKNGKITDARALQAPTGRSDRYTQFAVPVLVQQTIAAQSAHIQGASGASYTSYGWATSLQVALTKAGL
jgi:uncharacterized protein with FMN-binding domain